MASPSIGRPAWKLPRQFRPHPACAADSSGRSPRTAERDGSIILNKVTAGKNQQFLVQVTNQGDVRRTTLLSRPASRPARAVDIGTSGPVADIKFEKELGLVRFSPVAELPPKATIDYRVVVTTSRPGPISLQAEATSHRQTQPAAGEETVDVLPAE